MNGEYGRGCKRSQKIGRLPKSWMRVYTAAAKEEAEKEDERGGAAVAIKEDDERGGEAAATTENEEEVYIPFLFYRKRLTPQKFNLRSLTKQVAKISAVIIV